MKKHITLLSGLLVVSGAFAQINQLPTQRKAMSTISVFDGKTTHQNQGTEKADGDLIFQDDFSGTFLWTPGTSGQGTFELGTNASPGISSSNQYMGNMASTTAANGFAFFNGVQYLLSATVDPQNTWVMSDTIDLSSTGSVSLTFQQRYRAFNSDVTYVEFSEDGGMTWSQSIVVNGAVATNASAVQNTVTVDFPVNNTQYGVVRFRWQETSDDNNYGSGYGWYVDDIKIYAGYGNNLELVEPHSYTGSQGLQYTMFPTTQAVSGTVEVQFDANMRNKGYNSQDANLTVTSGAYNQTGADATVPSFMDSLVEILTPNGFMVPTAVGASDFTFTVGSSSSTLDVTSDDSGTMPFEVTDWIMAQDTYDGTAASIDGSFTAFSSQSQGDLTGIGNYFEIFEDGEIGGVQVGIATVQTQSTYIGREFYVTLLKYNGTDFEYVMQTDPIIVAASHFGNIVDFVFDPITVNAGDLYIALANAYVGAGTTGGVPFAFAGTHPQGTTIGCNGENFPDDLIGLASDPATPTIVEAPVVRLNFQDQVSIADANVVTAVTTAPNPFSNETTVSFNLKNDAAVSLVVTDLAGRTVYTVASANMTAGTQSINIDGAGLTAGVYNYTLKIGNTAVTNRIVKK